MPKVVDHGSGVYRRCRGCQIYRPLREFERSAAEGSCRACAPPVAMKLCVGCEHTKSIDEFHVDRKARDGRRAECKGCRNAATRSTWREKRDQERRSPAKVRDLSFFTGAWA